MTTLLSRIRGPADVRALPPSEIPALCAELRAEIIRICGKVGGHLGASLGAVELIVAFHRVFHSPHDALVFDVGHQAYAHKLLTGRAERMDSLRQEGGIAPFLDPTESEHDIVGAGHACTAVSTALGILEARLRQRRPGRVVALLGDGALTGGLSFEGLNNAGSSEAPLVVVLNDNQMSISANVGAVHALLRTDHARRLFEGLGFTYLGPVDGHDLPALERALRDAKSSNKPIVVHCHTQKGKGLAEAEADARTRGHAMGPYEWRDGKLVRSRGGQRTFSEAFAGVLEQAMEADRSIAVVTPAMLEGSALTGLQSRFPDRVFDVGIAEQHAVTFSAGLAIGGMRPVCAVYSTFLQRAYDQVVHDVVLPGLPVIFAIDRAGLVGADGATHQGAYDISFLRPLPGLSLMAPMVGEDLGPMFAAALASKGPSALRFPRGTLSRLPVGIQAEFGAPGEARWLQRVSSATATVVTFGTAGLWALEAAAGRPWNVLDARFASPLPEEELLEAAATGRVVVVEEGTVHGGFGSGVLELYAARRLTPSVRLLGLPDQFIRHGDARVQRAALGLDPQGIRAAIEALGG